jgi:hypothetical protein
MNKRNTRIAKVKFSCLLIYLLYGILKINYDILVEAKAQAGII